MTDEPNKNNEPKRKIAVVEAIFPLLRRTDQERSLYPLWLSDHAFVRKTREGGQQMKPPVPHKDIDMQKPPPKGISEAEKALRLVGFWQQWAFSVRELIVRDIERSPHYFFNIQKGIQVAILRGLEEIDMGKMKSEVEKASLLLKGTGGASTTKDAVLVPRNDLQILVQEAEDVLTCNEGTVGKDELQTLRKAVGIAKEALESADGSERT